MPASGEFLQNLDRLVVEYNESAPALLIVIGNAFDTIPIHKLGRFFLPFRKVADCAVDIHTVRFGQRIHNLANDCFFAKAAHIVPVFELVECQPANEFLK